MKKVHLIIGTVMGTAKGVAAEAEKLLSDRYSVKVSHKFVAGTIASDEAILICTSSTGVGDLPTNIAPLLVHLKNDYPQIAGQKYGLINLGDSHYPSFAEAGKKLDAALRDLGAVNTLPPLLFDASEGAPSLGELKMWLNEWGATL